MNNATPPKGRYLLPAAAFLLLGTVTAPIPSAETAAPVYVPPLRGAPNVRFAGGSRGDAAGVLFDALTPPHVGRTSIDQPRLYWRISQLPPAGAALQLVLTEQRGSPPLLEVPLALPLQPGLQVIDLANFGTRLLPGRTYRWSLVLRPDGANTSREKTTVAGGIVTYAPLSKGDSAELGRTPDTSFDRAYFFGRIGYWYDCIDAVASVVITNPTAEAERRAVESLISQVEKRTNSDGP